MSHAGTSFVDVVVAADVHEPDVIPPDLITFTLFNSQIIETLLPQILQYNLIALNLRIIIMADSAILAT